MATGTPLVPRSIKNLSRAKAHQFALQTGFPAGYRNREDITLLPAGVMVVGSKNVVTSVRNSILSRKGYTLDGAANINASAVNGAYDWTKILNNDTHVKSWAGEIDFRYVNPVTGTVTWLPIITGLGTDNFNFTTFWSPLELTTVMTGVNNTPNMYEWSGGVATYASATTSTLTKTGTDTWAQSGFYTLGHISASTIAFVAASKTITDSGSGFISSGFSAGQSIIVSGTLSNNGTFTIASVTAGVITLISTDTLVNEGAGSTFVINSVRQVIMYDNGGTARTFNYTGGETTLTLTGVTPDPTAFTFTANETAAFQAIRTVPNSAMTGIPATFNNTVIGNLLNQIYIGSDKSNYLYISRTSDYTNYTQVNQAQPRAPGDGSIKTLAGYVYALVVQDQDMYIGAGRDLIYKTTYVQTTTSTTVAGAEVSTVYEQINIDQVKTAALQGIQSQAATTKIKNNIAYLSFEPIINTLGSVNGMFQNVQVTDISYPIVNDMNNYDLTDACCFYFRQFLYISIPREGLIRVYNMTDSVIPTNGAPHHYWEAPLTIPIGRFSIIDDELYGHGYSVPETYKLFNGYNDNGQPIESIIKFSFQNYGLRSTSKSFNQYYVEGYISSNTSIMLGLQYDVDGCATNTSFKLSGTDTQVVCIARDDSPFGKTPLGKKGLGNKTITATVNTNSIPKFRLIQTFPRVPFYEFQASFWSLGTDQQWELLSFGSAVMNTFEGNNPITK